MNKILFREILMPEGDGNSAGAIGIGTVGTSNGSGGEFQGGVSNAGSSESMGIEAAESSLGSADNELSNSAPANSSTEAENSSEAEAPTLMGETDQNLSTSINSEINIPNFDPGVTETNIPDLMKPGEIKDFTPENIKKVPTGYKGVYKIYEYDSERIDEVNIGKSKNDVRGRLRSHYQGKGNKTVGVLRGYEDQFNLKFSIHPSDNPERDEALLLESPLGLPPGNHRRETSKLPSENHFENEDKSVEELGEIIEENKSNREKEFEKAREFEKAKESEIG
jgi:hypothetical protein